MASFEISVRGIALCFYETADKTWNIILPCDDDHLAELVYDQRRLNLRTAGRAVTIDFPPEAIVPEAPSHKPSPPGLFNMSEIYAHDKRSSTKSYLDKRKLEMSDGGIFHDFVRLRIPNATMSSREETKCDYYVEELDEAGQAGVPNPLKKKMHRVAVFEFSSTNDISLVAKDLRDNAFSEAFATFPTNAVVPYSLEIDNHCRSLACPKKNDFTNLYWIVEDPRGKRFQAGQEVCGAAEVEEEERMEIFTVPYGNCDPAESNPPPGP